MDLARGIAIDKLSCTLVGRCGGCPLGQKTIPEQQAEKRAGVAFLNPDVRFRYSSAGRVRDRADLIWENGRLGLYEYAEGSDRSSHIIDIPACPMMSEPLERFFLEVRQLAPPGVRKGSIRLRVSPAGERGVWLDFANADVKTLLDEREYLRGLSERAFVEIGQRRKALVWREDLQQWKLGEPVLKPWFETYGRDGEAIPLFGPVGGFSQAGFAANRALVATVTEFADKSGEKNWLELFSGNGNLALALAARGFQVEAFELDELALQGLAKSLEVRPDLRERVRFARADVYLQEGKLPPFAGRGLLVDPPRAGLREVLSRLKSGDQPRSLLYVSCHNESFAADARELLTLGYRLTELAGIDQFPHSRHCEWVALFTR